MRVELEDRLDRRTVPPAVRQRKHLVRAGGDADITSGNAPPHVRVLIRNRHHVVSARAQAVDEELHGHVRPAPGRKGVLVDGDLHILYFPRVASR